MGQAFSSWDADPQYTILMLAERGNVNGLRAFFRSNKWRSVPDEEKDAIWDRILHSDDFYKELGSPEILAVILRDGSTPLGTFFTRDPMPIHIAADAGNKEAVRTLSEISNPIWFVPNALEEHDFAFLTTYLDANGMNVNSPFYNESQLIQFAAAKDDLTALQWLLDKGVDVNGGTKTALLFAAFSGALKSAQFLLDHGADIQRRSPATGQTALHSAVSVRNNNPMIRFLLEKGADPNIPDANGVLPTNPQFPGAKFLQQLLYKREMEGAAGLVDRLPKDVVQHEILAMLRPKRGGRTRKTRRRRTLRRHQ